MSSQYGQPLMLAAFMHKKMTQLRARSIPTPRCRPEALARPAESSAAGHRPSPCSISCRIAFPALRRLSCTSFGRRFFRCPCNSQHDYTPPRTCGMGAGDTPIPIVPGDFRHSLNDGYRVRSRPSYIMLFYTPSLSSFAAVPPSISSFIWGASGKRRISATSCFVDAIDAFTLFGIAGVEILRIIGGKHHALRLDHLPAHSEARWGCLRSRPYRNRAG